MSRPRYYPAVFYGSHRGVFLPADRDPIPLRRQAAFWANVALQLLYPPRCPFCGELSGPELMCAPCARELARQERKHKRLDPGQHCIAALEGAAAVYPYHGEAKEALLAAKYHGEAWYAPQLGCLMAQKLFGCTIARHCGILYPERISAAALGWDRIVPVPSSRRGRGYNIPTLLAQPLCEGLGLPLLTNVLFRKAGSTPQAELDYAERLENAAGAFLPTRRAAAQVEGKRILLVDDVITTGATVAACTQALLAAGAESVFAVSLCVSERGDKFREPASSLAD